MYRCSSSHSFYTSWNLISSQFKISQLLRAAELTTCERCKVRRCTCMGLISSFIFVVVYTRLLFEKHSMRLNSNRSLSWVVYLFDLHNKLVFYLSKNRFQTQLFSDIVNVKFFFGFRLWIVSTKNYRVGAQRGAKRKKWLLNFFRFDFIFHYKNNETTERNCWFPNLQVYNFG